MPAEAVKDVSAAQKPILSMREAVSRYVPDGQELLIGGFAFSDPTALAHELIRQRRRDLFVMKTSGGVLVDQLVGAGCVKRVLSCHVWNSVGPVAAHCFRRALEQEKPHAIEIEELSYGAFTMALMAGACDLPFMPTTPVQGAGHFTQRSYMPNKFGVVENPFGGGPVCVVPPLKPALGFFHVHRVDAYGNAQLFGPDGRVQIRDGRVPQARRDRRGARRHRAYPRAPGSDRRTRLHGGRDRRRALGRPSHGFVWLLPERPRPPCALWRDDENGRRLPALHPGVGASRPGTTRVS